MVDDYNSITNEVFDATIKRKEKKEEHLTVESLRISYPRLPCARMAQTFLVKTEHLQILSTNQTAISIIFRSG